MSSNNEVILTGLITEFGFSHRAKNNAPIYCGKIQTSRLSGVLDTVPFYTLQSNIEIGKCHTIVGEMRTSNLRNAKGHSHKIIYVKPYIIWRRQNDDEVSVNSVELCGYLVSKSPSRFTPLGRRIADFVIALNDEFGKSSYPNLIAWGNAARMIDTFYIGDLLRVTGRFQSREYEKEGTMHTVYEISCSEVHNINDSLCD